MLMDRNTTTNFFHVLVGVMVAVVMSSAVPVWRCVVFAIGLAIPVLLQLRLAKRMAAANWQPGKLLAAQREFDALALWVGIMWGFAGLFCFQVEILRANYS